MPMLLRFLFFKDYDPFFLLYIVLKINRQALAIGQEPAD